MYGPVDNDYYENEKRAVLKLCQSSHPNILQVYEVGQLRKESVFFFIDMELCSFTLAHYLRGSEVPALEKWESTPERILDILQPIIEGLVFIHEQGEVHRDIKPENSMSKFGPSPGLMA